MDNSNQAPQDDQQVTQQAPVVPTPPVAPTGSMHKEAGPAISRDVEYTMTPSSPTETAPELDQEVQEAGVEQSVDSTELQLNEEHAAAGITPAKESVPVLANPQTPATVQIANAPFTPQEAVEILKTTPTDDTKHWLAVLVQMVYKKAHFLTTAAPAESEQKVA